MSDPKVFSLTASEREPLAGAKEIGPAKSTEMVDVTIRLRRKDKKPVMSATEFTKPIHERTHLTRHQFEQQHGADPASIARIEAFANEHKLTVKEKSAARRTVILSGTVAAVSHAFGVQLKEYQYKNITYRGRTGTVQLPADLQDIVEGVFGLDNRPQAKPHFRRRPSKTSAQAETSLQYTPPEVAAIYNFPTNQDGTGQTIALIELGGGYTPTDLTNYWKQLKLTKTPAVSAVSIGNGSNKPTGDPNSADGEVLLDIEVCGSIAPGAKIVVYFAENTDAGFLNAITTAVHDSTNNPTIVSISWGGPESAWTQQAMTSMDEAFQSAAAMGVTVCIAAGDNGSTDGVDDGQYHVDFPSSSPNVLSCGGTKLVGSGNTITSETVWNELPNNEGATGGGFSTVFPLPAYQTAAGLPPGSYKLANAGRGVPDVAGNADPTTGYVTLTDGQQGVVGGTSAVAPLWAALLALINQNNNGKGAGFINPLLYQNTAGAPAETNDIKTGNNGLPTKPEFGALTGWDACTGIGSPIGTGVEAALNKPSAQGQVA
ncbi:MAG TPA: S53 family peptidase [Terriglobales bacterium]